MAGIVFAALAGVGWGLYIVITQHVGDRFSGVDGLAISLPVAPLVTAVVGLPQAWGHITLQVLLVGLAAAVLLPLIPWTLELYALRRLTKAAFGTLMALEPAIALLIGIVVLSQIPAGSPARRDRLRRGGRESRQSARGTARTSCLTWRRRPPDPSLVRCGPACPQRRPSRSLCPDYWPAIDWKSRS